MKTPNPLKIMIVSILFAASAQNAFASKGLFHCSASNNQSFSFQLTGELNHADGGVPHSGFATNLHKMNAAIKSSPVEIFVDSIQTQTKVGFKYNFHLPNGTAVELTQLNDASSSEIKGQAQLPSGQLLNVSCSEEENQFFVSFVSGRIHSSSKREQVIYDTAFGEQPDVLQMNTYKTFKSAIAGKKLCSQDQTESLEFDIFGNMKGTVFGTNNENVYYKIVFSGSNSGYLTTFFTKTDEKNQSEGIVSIQGQKSTIMFRPNQMIYPGASEKFFSAQFCSI